MRPKRTDKAVKSKSVKTEYPTLGKPVEALPTPEPAPMQVISMPAAKKTPIYQAQEPLVLPVSKGCTKRILEARTELSMHEAALAQIQAEMQRLQGNIREYALMTLDDHDAVCEGEMTISEDATVLTMQRRPKLVEKIVLPQNID